MPIIDLAHPKITEMTFSFPEFVTVWKKISSIHLFILEIQYILESHEQTGHICF